MGGSSTTKQETTNRPPAWAAPLFKQSAQEAQSIYDSGAGGNVYQGDTVADLGGTTQSGISGVQGAANLWGGQQFQNMLTAPTQAGQNLSGMASGQYLQEGNPFYRERLQGQIDDMASTVGSTMSGAGRYGSGAHQGIVAENAGNMLLQGLETDYNRAMGNMLTANSMIDSSRNAQLGNMMNAFTGQMGAQQGVINAGQVEDRQAQQELTADVRRWEMEDMAPWTRLGLLQSAAAGAAGNYGTNTQTQTTPGNPLQAIGTAGQLALGMTGKSDIRLKKNYRPVGHKNGHRIWEFEYIDRPGRFRGVMAQEVALTHPASVIMESDGYLAVRYGDLGIEMEQIG